MSDYSFCVSVTDDEGRPVQGATVKVFDVDPLRDDPLPSAGGVTDDEGRLMKTLDPREFRPTPIPGLDYESGGPNLYFHVQSGLLSVKEDRSAGWSPFRSVRKGQVLNIALALNGANEQLAPQFTHIGDFRIGSNIDPTSGLTTAPQNGHGGPHYAFHRTLTLRGKMRAAWAQQPIQYRFLWTPQGSSSAVPVTADMIEYSNLGVREILWDDKDGPGPKKALQTVQVGPVGADPVGGSGPLPDEYVIEPATDGWITVPPDTEIIPDVLLRLDTRHASIHKGGDNVGGSGVTGTITFEARIGQSQTYWTQSQVVRINNWSPVPKLTIAPAPCAPVEDHLELLYSFDHEYPRNASLTVTATTPWNTDGHDATTKLVPTVLFRGWQGHHFVENHDSLSNNGNPLADWAQCPYTVNFKGSLKLTDGFIDAGNFGAAPVTFCKRKKNTVPQ